MNIQIFGRSKCFDTKKAQRWFKERRIKYQEIDLKKYGISRGELASVKNAAGLNALIDDSNPDSALLQYLAYDQDKLDKLFEEAVKTQPEPLYYSADGVHPNANGSAFIGKHLADAFAALMEQK